MGLAEPRKRVKISHDPRNTSWTNSANSYGQRLMQSQGWKSGESLGAKGRGSKFSDAEAAKVNVKYKDDMLGLGASLKSKDLANQKTGFDAFQGLLGRLNAKTEEEVQAVEKKVEDKKLAMFAQGRWGGMLFVPGGILVQSDPYKQVEALKKAKEEEAEKLQSIQEDQTAAIQSKVTGDATDEAREKARRKADKKQRKEEKRLRKEQKRLKKGAKTSKREEEEPSLPTPDSSSSNEGDTTDTKHGEKSKKRQRVAEPKQVSVDDKPTLQASAGTTQQLRNGRHLLRGRNIQAKRMAFSDMKGLDEIFMKVG